MRKRIRWIILPLALALISCGSGGDQSRPETGSADGSSTGGQTNPVCAAAGSTVAVQEPVFVRNLDGRTGWFASPLVADLDHNGQNKIVTAHDSLYVFDEAGNRLDRADGNGSRIYAPHVVVDLEGDGIVEIACGQGHEVYVYEWRDGGLRLKNGWPADTTTAGQAPEIRGMAAADLDDDLELEIVVTYDNHHIQVFDHDGVAHDASRYFTNRQGSYLGNPMTWGQFIRWADPVVEENHYHLHTGDWPHPDHQEWLQWTHSPPNVADLDGDGRNEVLGIPNVEKETDPYVTQAYAVMVLEGTYGDGQRSARRLAGWEILPRGETPVGVDGWYPPATPPAAATNES